MSFFDKPTKLNAITPIDYTDFNNHLICIKPEPHYLKINHLYYFKNKHPLRFPKEYKNTYLLIKLIRVFPSSKSQLKPTWYPYTNGNVTETTALYHFQIVGYAETEEIISRRSKLHGFQRVIDDNYYFSAIPQINELYHWDNGIISSINCTVDYSYHPEISWDNFTISHKTEFESSEEIIKMALKGHEHPDR